MTSNRLGVVCVIIQHSFQHNQCCKRGEWCAPEERGEQGKAQGEVVLQGDEQPADASKGRARGGPAARYLACAPAHLPPRISIQPAFVGPVGFAAFCFVSLLIYIIFPNGRLSRGTTHIIINYHTHTMGYVPYWMGGKPHQRMYIGTCKMRTLRDIYIA